MMKTLAMLTALFAMNQAHAEDAKAATPPAAQEAPKQPEHYQLVLTPAQTDVVLAALQKVALPMEMTLPIVNTLVTQAKTQNDALAPKKDGKK